MIANPWFLAAGAAAFATFLLHVYAGGRLVVPPLLSSALPSVVKHTHYYCWHLVSAALALMAGAFAWAAVTETAREAAWIATALAVAFCIVNFTQNMIQRLRFAHHPQGVIFLVIAALGFAGFAYG
jgi:hypothetical protein